MGLTNFVNNFLSNARHSPRHSQSPHNASPPPDRFPKSTAPNPPRRRRHQPVHVAPSYKDKEDWGIDWEPEWLLDDEPVSREYDSSRRLRRKDRRARRQMDEPVSTASAAFPSRGTIKSFDDDVPDWHSRPSLPLKARVEERFDGPSSRSRRQNRDGPPSRRADRDDRDTPSSRDGPSSRRLTAWRRRAGRTKSNLEESGSQEPTTPPRFRNSNGAFPLAADDDASISDSPPSLKRLLASARAAASKQFQEATPSKDATFRGDTPSGLLQMLKRDSSSSRDGTSRRSSSSKHDGAPRRRAGRIMSNIDQFIHRDGSVDSPSNGRRRQSTLSDASGYANPASFSSSEPISIANETHVPPEPETREMRKSPLQTKEQQTEPSKTSRQSPPPKPPPLPPPNGKSKPPRIKAPLKVKADVGERIPVIKPPKIGEGERQMRLSADAVFPPRPKVTVSQAFARSQSNPQPPTQPTAPGLKRAHLKRPPPLLTPVNGSPGFAFGVGADSSGIRRVNTSRENASQADKLEKDQRSIDFPVTTSAVTDESSDFNDTATAPLESDSKGLGEMETGSDDEVAEPKAYAKSDIWKTDLSKSGMRSKNRVRSGDVLGSRTRPQRKFSDKEQELFLFEEASQSSFGDTESPSKVAARNGIVPMDQRAISGEVMEDNFVFGADESFSDGGFIISSDGRVDLPEKVTRKMSDGLAVDGVPSSSSNVILVRDLSEFRKKYTFKDRSSEKCNPTLGRGAAGKVYLAVHQPSGLKIAVKEINIFDQDRRDQFKKELVTLIGHQSRFLVRSYGAFYGGNGAVHVVLEYMDRGSLSDIIAQMGPIPEPVVRKIAEHCLRGLCFLHDNHILHRDVKTGNILLSRKLCRAKLSDFGLARNFNEGRGEGETTGDGSSVSHTFVGTVLYMSPERLNGEEYTYASDIWGVGMAILECILGRYPFDKPQSYFDILVSASSAPQALMEHDNVSDELGDFIALATHNDPNQRPTARELLRHPWIQSGQDNVNGLREWLDSIPRLHCQNVEVGSELAFGAKQKKEARAMAKIRAKAKETNRNM